MIKKTVTYEDYNGKTRTEEHLFDLSEAEVIDMEMESETSLSDQLKKLVKEEDQRGIYRFFKDLVRKSYGVKSADGRRFEKSQQLADEFVQTRAYVKIFTSLALNADEASAFVKGVLPVEALNKAIDDANKTQVSG